MAVAKRVEKEAPSRKRQETRSSALAYARSLPRLSAIFCHSVDCTTRLHLSSAQVRAFETLPKVTKVEDSLQLDMQFRENGEWVHLYVGVTSPKANTETDVTLGMHTLRQTGERPYLKEPVREVLTTLSASPEAPLLVTADFGFPLDRFKPAIDFPEVDVPILGAPVRISGVRFRFDAGPLKTFILDSGTRQIFVSLSMTLSARISPDLPAELVTQTKALAARLVTEHGAQR